MKTKLKIRNSGESLMNFESACEFSEIEKGLSMTFGDQNLVEVNFKKPSQLFEAGMLYERLTVSGKKVEKAVQNLKEETKQTQS
jgi:hypothetical protein